MPIANILEVRLAPAHWNRIKIAVYQRRTTYSMITRYCALRLARKCSVRWTQQLRRRVVAVSEGVAAAKEMHRHLMCLYGEDEKLIRLAAIELGLTMTAFVRLALELYLPMLAMENHNKRFVSRGDLIWEGIRLIQDIQIFAVNTSSRPLYRHLSCTHFDPESYW